jgi:hypothetical protein
VSLFEVRTGIPLRTNRDIPMAVAIEVPNRRPFREKDFVQVVPFEGPQTRGIIRDQQGLKEIRDGNRSNGPMHGSVSRDSRE